MATLDGIQIFAVGKWNGTEFDRVDLDGLVSAFEDEQQAGRLPVKLGHSAPDTEPSRGWIEKIWREGDKLLARIDQVPQEIVDGIKSGAWRHVSVELLKEVQTAAGRSYRWMLDGLALLGAARPAVDVLKPLHESLSSRATGATFAARLAFATALPGDESVSLRRENERLRLALHRQSIDATIESDVRGRVVMAAAREAFRRVFHLTDDASYSRITLHDWRSFAATQPRPPANGPAAYSGGEDSAIAPDAALVAKVRAYVRDNELRHLQLTGERLTFDRAAPLVVREVARSSPGLLRGWLDQPGTID
jgi:hypothetical protein